MSYRRSWRCRAFASMIPARGLSAPSEAPGQRLRPAYDFWHNEQARAATTPGVAMATIRPNGKKFRELILYITIRCAGDPIFDKIKLNRILFYSDFLAYFRTGRPITGQKYRRLPDGPGASGLEKTLEEMMREGDVAFRCERKLGPRQERVLALREPDLRRFSGQHLAIVDHVISLLRDRSHMGVSQISHLDIGWQLARDEETIPYETVFLSNRPLTAAELEYGRRLAAELGRS